MTQSVLPVNENRCIIVLIVLMLINKSIHTLQITYNFYLLNKLALNVNLPRRAHNFLKSCPADNFILYVGNLLLYSCNYVA